MCAYATSRSRSPLMPDNGKTSPYCMECFPPVVLLSKPGVSRRRVYTAFPAISCHISLPPVAGMRMARGICSCLHPLILPQGGRDELSRPIQLVGGDETGDDDSEQPHSPFAISQSGKQLAQNGQHLL